MYLQAGYWDAVLFVVQKRSGSISGLQRHFKGGYLEAKRHIYDMEDMGVVSEIQDNGRRLILWPELEFSSEEE